MKRADPIRIFILMAAACVMFSVGFGTALDRLDQCSRRVEDEARLKRMAEADMGWCVEQLQTCEAYRGPDAALDELESETD